MDESEKCMICCCEVSSQEVALVKSKSCKCMVLHHTCCVETFKSMGFKCLVCRKICGILHFTSQVGTFGVFRLPSTNEIILWNELFETIIYSNHYFYYPNYILYLILRLSIFLQNPKDISRFSTIVIYIITFIISCCLIWFQIFAWHELYCLLGYCNHYLIRTIGLLLCGVFVVIPYFRNGLRDINIMIFVFVMVELKSIFQRYLCNFILMFIQLNLKKTIHYSER